MLSALALLAVVAVAEPAFATTYSFSIPVGKQVSPNPNTLMWALAGALANDQTPVVTFQIYALAIKYTTAGGTTLSAKNLPFTTNLDLVGTAPEPSTILAAAGGLCLLLAAGIRRSTAAPAAY